MKPRWEENLSLKTADAAHSPWGEISPNQEFAH
jgi:hypothetical protein